MGLVGEEEPRLGEVFKNNCKSEMLCTEDSTLAENHLMTDDNYVYFRMDLIVNRVHISIVPYQRDGM